MFSEFTYDVVKNDFEVRELDMVKVMGKNKPVRIYEVICKKDKLTKVQKETFKLFAEGLRFYRKMLWDQALETFGKAEEILPTDGATQIYIKRCEENKKNPPDEPWDGVHQMLTK